jgi:class 3 adenylate cyclase
LRDVVGRDWSLLFVVPEDDFVGFVAANNRTTLLMSIAVVALAVMLAALLAYQGLRADSTARLLRKRQRVLEAQGRAFADLAASAALFDAERPEGAREATTAVANALAARRASLWRFRESGSTLFCEDCYDHETKGHSAGAEFVERDCPDLFEAMLRGDEINVADAALDPRTVDLHRIYLEPVGCRSLLAAPIRNRGRIAGSIWIEDGGTHGDRAADALTFARAVAGMLSARFAEPRGGREQPAEAVIRTVSGALPNATLAAGGGGRSTAGSVAPQSAMRTATVADERNRRLMERLAVSGLDKPSSTAKIFPDTSILVLRFLDPVAIAERTVETGETVMIDSIVCALQQIAADHGIVYLKILNNQIVAAEGFLGDARRQAVAILESALAVQDYCAKAPGHNVDFTIGVDTGTVVGSPVGFGSSPYNVWGEALRVASAMAASAPQGTIQVTESTYRQVADRYVFRKRGAFYMERVGELSTYVLKGRI